MCTAPWNGEIIAAEERGEYQHEKLEIELSGNVVELQQMEGGDRSWKDK